MNEPPSTDDVITEIIDQRRPVESKAKPISVAVVLVIALLCGTFLINKGCNAPGEAVDKGVKLAERFAAYCEKKLGPVRTTETVVTNVGQVIADKEGKFTTASQDVLLQFTTSDVMAGSKSTAEVRVLGRAHYYVPLLSDKWVIETIEKDGMRICRATAPELRALTPVGFDSKSVEIKVETGWIRFNEAEMRNEAYGQITTRLNAQAQLGALKARDASRQAISAFLKTWLLEANLAGQPKDGKINAIQVLFPGESADDINFHNPNGGLQILKD